MTGFPFAIRTRTIHELALGLTLFSLGCGDAGAPGENVAVFESALSDAPDPSYVTNGSVHAFARSGNTLYLGGSFSYIGPRTGSLPFVSTQTGTLSAGWPEVGGGSVSAIASDGAGGWYIGGDFTKVGGFTRLGLAHIKSDKTVDPQWIARIDAGRTVLALVYSAATSQVYVGGTFTSIAGISRNGLAALAANGTVSAWNPSPNGAVHALRIFKPATGSQLVLVGGVFTQISGVEQYNFTAYADSAIPLGRACDYRVNGPVYAIEPHTASNTVYLGGSFSQIRKAPSTTYEPSGALVSFNFDTNLVNGSNCRLIAKDLVGSSGSVVNALATNGGQLYVGGKFLNVLGTGRNNLAAIDIQSSSLSAWNPSPNAPVYALAFANSSVYAGGSFSTVGGQSRDYLAALNPTTGVPSAWNVVPSGTVSDLAVTGTVALVGGVSSVNGSRRSGLASVDLTTGKASSFSPQVGPDTNGKPGMVETLAITGTDVLVGGTFVTLDSLTRNGFGRYDASGRLSTWNPNPSSGVFALAVSGSNVFLGGGFSTVGGVAHERIALVSLATGQVQPWNPGPINGSVSSLSLLGQTLYVGGGFTTVNGFDRLRLAALDATSGALGDWAPDADKTIEDLLATPSGIYVAGQFSSVGGQSRKALALVDANTGAATSFNANVSGLLSLKTTAVHAISINDRVLFIAGDFASVGGTARYGFALVDSTTGALGDWNPKASFFGGAYTVLATPDKLFLGGSLRTVGDITQTGYAQFALP